MRSRPRSVWPSTIATPQSLIRHRWWPRGCAYSYNDGVATSTEVPADALATILAAWSNGPRAPQEKGPRCEPTTPTWVLSGVTQWGNPVQITAVQPPDQRR